MTADLTTPTLALDLIDLPQNLRGNVGDTSELEGSIQNMGLIEPLVVRANGDGRYELLAGRRRYMALTNLGMGVAPVHVIDHPDQDPEIDRIRLQLVENLQRVDLDPVEEASGYAQLKRLGLRQRQIATEIGRSEAHISKRLSLLKLPTEVIDLASSGRLTSEDLYELTKVVSAGGDLAPIVEHVAATDRDDTPDPHGEIEQLAKHAIREKTAAEKVSARKAELEANGVTVLDVGDQSHTSISRLPKDTAKLGGNPIWDLHREQHADQDCHAVVVYESWGTLYEDPVCVDVKRHGPGGDSKLQSSYLQSKEDQKQIDAKHRREAERRAERTAKRNGALRAAARAVLAGRAPARDRVLGALADRWVRLAVDDYGVEDIMIDILDLETEVSGAGILAADELLGLYDAGDGPNRTKIVLAGLLAEMIDQCSSSLLNEKNDPVFVSLVDLLTDMGGAVDIDGFELDEETGG